ncbi:MAG: trypsin-like peptidase domain-containing protein [Planctomycetales bacterium]|nr:trypsin-like peptidase domain-containing protein [Planctomycetales bacterium]
MVTSARTLRRSFIALALVAGTVGVARGEVVLLDFTIPGCGPCQQMRPVVAQLGQQGHSVREVDASREPDMAQRFNVDRFPTFIVTVDGREFARLVGRTSGSQLAAMLREANAQDSAVRPVSHEDLGGPGGPRTYADEPRPGRVVALQNDWPQNQRAPASVPGTVPGTPLAAAATPFSAAPSSGNLIAATVRLRVQDPEGASTGAGTVIDSRQGRALVLTCGHIFRASAGKGAISVTLFREGPQGAVEVETVEGIVREYDLVRDLGLVEIAPSGSVAAVRLGSPALQLASGEAVQSVGCNHGAAPTVMASQVVRLNGDRSMPYVEATGAPVEGRSGGGLFNSRGELVGVCFAADPQANQGLYASLEAICGKLDEKNLSFVYQYDASSAAAVASAATPNPPSQIPTGTSAVPALPAAAPLSSRGQSRDAEASFENLLTSTASGPVTSQEAQREESTLSAKEQATLEEIQRLAARSEVICVIMPQTPGGVSDVIKISNASPEFVRRLSETVAK